MLSRAAPHGGQERDVSSGIDRRSVEAGQHARGDPRRGRPAQGDGPDAAVAGDEDALDRAPLGDGRREHDRAVVAEPGYRMLAEAREAAHPRDAIALARHDGDATARPEEEPLVGAGAAERGEERDVTARVHRRDDRHRLRPEAIEDSAAGRGLAGGSHTAQPGRLVA